MADVLAGYETGPDATLRALAIALERLDSARVAILVEGVSDQIAVDVTAARRGLDLAAGGVLVVPIGGAHAIGHVLAEIVERAPRVVLAGLFDVGEERFVRRAVVDVGLGAPADRAGLARLGFFVCVDDLEDELLRAAGRGRVEHLLAEQGDATSFARLRAQPPWRGQPFEAQFRRFLGAGSRRKHRYAAAIAGMLPPDEAPSPLRHVLGHVAG